jgi:exonuclease SbcC
MIPQRIAMRGFLCYRDEQEICLDGAPLWLLAGSNGSGKSAVFDAVTYALFGGHRGGIQGAQALVNKATDGLCVEFDFLLENRLHQARRTLKLNKKGGVSGTQQIRRRQSGAQGNGHQHWETVPDTTNKTGFDAWIRAHLGLTYETFTSSVLLMQGKADKLLSAAPKERFEVLASLVDLNRYQKLHRRVDERRRSAQSWLETLQHQLAGLPDVSDAELQQADQVIEDNRQALQQAHVEVERLGKLVLQAQRWLDLEARLEALRRQFEEAQALLTRADVIRRDAERQRDLRTALPSLKTILEQQLRARELDRKIFVRAEERHELARRLEELDKVLADSQQQRLREDERQAVREERGQALAKELQSLSVGLVLLRQIQRERASLGEAQQRAGQALQQFLLLEQQANRLNIEHDTLCQELQTAASTRQKWDAHVTERRTLLEEARKRGERFYSVVGEKICRYCGQALSPAHVSEERIRLEGELATAEQHYQEALPSLARVKLEEQRVLESYRSVDHLLADVRERMAQCRRHHDEAQHDAEQRTARCDLAYKELDQAFRARIAALPPEDWLATVFPSLSDLDQLQQRRLDLEAEALTLKKERLARQSRLSEYRQKLVSLEAEQRNLQRKLSALDRLLAEDSAASKASREIVQSVRQSLPASWQSQIESPTLGVDLPQWEIELALLAEGGAESAAEKLQRVHTDLESLQVRRRECESEQAEIPVEARRQPAQLEERLAQARSNRRNWEESLHAAQEARSRLVHCREQKRELEKECLAVAGRHKSYALLSELLGRHRLQLHLVRRAESRIVDYANAVLDRLSEGQLYLRLGHEPNEETGVDQALHLEAYNRTTGADPLSVAFLSGSQRFRVAVALALGIGQYASRRHQPIESVIIDEGFGCLDRQGRQAVIQELQNLRGQLRCILLVSHQEEFAEAFADGYRFELVDGATVVSRFQR